MIKFRLQISVLVLLMLSIYTSAQNKYTLHLKGVDKDSTYIIAQTGIQTIYSSRLVCEEYINKLPELLQSKGFVTASIDSLNFEPDHVRMVLYIGVLYKWAQLTTNKADVELLNAIGWREKLFAATPLNFTQVQALEDKILTYLENNGHPFARVSLENLQLDKDKVSALLSINKGPLYKIDSIRVYGNAKISNRYLQQYLDLPNESIYSKIKLLQVEKKMRELTYIEEEKPSDITLLGTGSVLNMYLKQRRSSQVNVLIGFLPNNDQLSSKNLLLTGEANILLKNAMGSGETIGLNWQQIQVKSPRLNILFRYPYLFNSPFGLDFTFDMFKKDSTFLNVNFQLGAQYVLNTTQSGKIFIQRFQTIVSPGGINEDLVRLTRQLPNVADVSSFNIGIDYELNKTDYRLNPRKGSELLLTASVGSKKIKKNDQILELKDINDPGFNFNKLYDTVKLKTYQFRIKGTAVKYFPLGKQRNTIKTAINAGLFQSGNVFRNELFQLGGYKLLRGFDEESQYLSQFAIGTVEYHYLVGQNSFFYVLADAGWGRNAVQKSSINYTYFGTGLGIAFETKAGIFNLAWAVGKRNDTELNLRQSKIHLGFVNYF